MNILRLRRLQILQGDVVVGGGRGGEVPEARTAGERRLRKVLPDGEPADAGEVRGEGGAAAGAAGQGVAREGAAGERDPQVVRGQRRHAHIVQLVDAFEWQGEYFMIMELCQNNSLKEFLRSRVRVTEMEAKYYLAQLVGGLEYLHGEGVVHRDIKLGNIFLNYKMEIKIGDFGLSTRVKSARERRFTTCGTPNYIAPEILAETGHSFEVDVWAVGIMLYALLVGRPPFESETVDETYRRIRSNHFEFPKQVPVSAEAKALIRQLLDPNPRSRASLQQVRASDFLTSQKIPPSMPAYTISLPPQSSFLKQYGGEKGAKLAIYPRKVSAGEEAHCSNSNARHRPKLSRVLSCDKNLFKLGEKGAAGKDLSELNRGVMFNTRMRNQLHCSSSSPSLPALPSPSSSRYEQDGNEVICYYDMSSKYGVGYLLSNGSFGVVFNDQTSLTALADDCFLYYDRRPLRLALLPESLRKKGEILRLCSEKLSSYREKNVLIGYQSEVYAQSFLRLGDMFVMKLSNAVLQFFWTCDVLTLRGFKWVKWRIARDEGEAALASDNLPAPVQQKVAIVRDFLQHQSERSKRRKLA